MTDTFGCVNNTIRLRSGKYLDLANPQPDQFTFADIAGGLSKICRLALCRSSREVRLGPVGAGRLSHARRGGSEDRVRKIVWEPHYHDPTVAEAWFASRAQRLGMEIREFTARET